MISYKALFGYALGWLIGEWLWPSHPHFGHFDEIASIFYFICMVWFLEWLFSGVLGYLRQKEAKS